jgi:hypothetical protein
MLPVGAQAIHDIRSCGRPPAGTTASSTKASIASPPAAGPDALQLSAAAAPADYDAGDHVNLTADGYSQVASQISQRWLAPYQYVLPHA